MTVPATSATNKLDGFKLLPDITILILYSFCLQPLIQWQSMHLALSCTLLMVLNIIAVSLSCFSFFSMYNDEAAMGRYKDSLSKFQRAATGLSAFISCLAFLWWLVPFAGAKAMGVKDIDSGIGMIVYFIAFIAVVAGSINNKKAIPFANAVWLKIITNIIIA